MSAAEYKLEFPFLILSQALTNSGWFTNAKCKSGIESVGLTATRGGAVKISGLSGAAVPACFDDETAKDGLTAR